MPEELKTTTPKKSKRLTWILGILALIFVVFVAVFFLTKNKKGVIEPDLANQKIVLTAIPKLVANPDNVSILNADLGLQKSEVRLSLAKESKDIKANVKSVELKNHTEKVTLFQTCTIALPCDINLTWEVDKPDLNINDEIVITYQSADAPEEMEPYKMMIPVTLQSAPAKSEPEPIPVEIEVPVDVEIPEPEPVAEPEPEPEPVKTKEEACYQYASKAYDLEGRPSGWIRPKGGVYYYHNYTDLNCSAPVGTYDIETGFIYSISNPNEKIGSDKESISLNTKSADFVPELSAPRFSERMNQSTPESLANIEKIQQDRINAANAVLGDNSQNPLAIMKIKGVAKKAAETYIPSSFNKGGSGAVSSLPKNNKFVLRQFKPIPAVIVNDIRVEADTLSKLAVQAVVERNVYSDNERVIIIPAGTLLLGQVDPKQALPGRYKKIGDIEINWYRFVRPDGAEFRFNETNGQPFSADAQGRLGVPGRGSTDYLQEFMMPLVTSLVPAAINMINPITSEFLNQLDLDNNTVTLTGQDRSSEKAKAEIISAWNNVANRIVGDMLDSSAPPFIVPAGTRITVFSPRDLMLRFDEFDNLTQSTEENGYVEQDNDAKFDFNTKDDYEKNIGAEKIATVVGGKVDEKSSDESPYQINTKNYLEKTAGSASNSVKIQNKTEDWEKYFTEEKQKEDAKKSAKKAAAAEASASSKSSVVCPDDGSTPDENGCCTGETYQVINGSPACCPADVNADCFDPLQM